MDPIGSSDSAIRFSLQAATSAAGTLDPRDGPGLAELLRHLKDLESHLQHAARRPGAQACALGIQITERLVCHLHPAPEDLLRWVHQLLQSLGASLGIDTEDEWSPRPQAPDPSSARPAPGFDLRAGGLRMAREEANRLGEILVQMSYLKASDVERALAMQRQTNCRLGEAMVKLGILSEKGLEAALRIQQRKRNTAD